MTEDLKGSEQVLLHAGKDLTTKVVHDASHWVGHDETTTVDHDRTEHVKHDETIIVDQNRTETVQANETVTIGMNRAHTYPLIPAFRDAAGVIDLPRLIPPGHQA